MTIMRHAIEVARHQWGYFMPSNPFDAVKKPKLKKADRDGYLKKNMRL